MNQSADELESIRQLKARYCRYLDTKDWAAWRTIFADDFLSDTSEAGGTVSDLSGGPHDIHDHQVLATNGRVHQEMTEIIRATLDGLDAV